MSRPELYKYFPSFHWVQRNLIFLWLAVWSKAKYITIFANVILIQFGDKLKSLCSTEVGFYKEKMDCFSCSDVEERWEWNINSSTLGSWMYHLAPQHSNMNLETRLAHAKKSWPCFSDPELTSLSLYVAHSFFFFKFLAICTACGVLFHNQGWNLQPLHWKAEF